MFKVSSANSMENLADVGNTLPEIQQPDKEPADSPLKAPHSPGSYMYQRQALFELATAPSHLEHVCGLDIDHESRHVRQTSLVATIGPSCDSKEIMREMILNGMNIARLNLTLGGYEYHTGVVKKLREVENELNLKPLVGIAVDITTPTIRTGFIHGKPNGKVELASGSFIELTTNDAYREASSAQVMWIDRSYFPNVLHAIKIGDRIFVDDGAISVIVRERTGDDRIKCLVEQGGPLSSSVRLGLPRKTLYKHFVAEKYRQDLLFAVENEVDMVFASYIESGDEVLRVKRVLNQMNPDIKLIARVETAQAVYNIDGILSVTDGVLIARGDLGLELPPQKVFLAQKTIVARANRAKVPVVVATQMLESMRFKPRPTRAEVSDVANAILDGADALVVTVETAKGNYPVETVQFLHRIAREAESAIFHNQLIDLKRAQSSRITSAIPSRPLSVGGSPRGSSASLLPPSHFAQPLLQTSSGFQMAAMYSNLNLNPDGSEAEDHTGTTALSAVEAAFKCCASAILVITTSGRAACQLSAFRPACPIIAIVRNVTVGRQCHLNRGIHPVLYSGAKVEDWAEDMDRRIHFGISYGQERGFLTARDNVIVVTGSRAGSGSTNTVRIIAVPDDHLEAPLRIVRSQQSFAPFDD